MPQPFVLTQDHTLQVLLDRATDCWQRALDSCRLSSARVQAAVEAEVEADGSESDMAANSLLAGTLELNGWNSDKSLSIRLCLGRCWEDHADVF